MYCIHCTFIKPKPRDRVLRIPSIMINITVDNVKLTWFTWTTSSILFLGLPWSSEVRGEGVDEGDEEDDAKHPEDGGQKRSKVLGVASVHGAKEAHQGEAEEGNAKVENLPRLRHVVNLSYYD